ncbi:MAG: Holliday junction branch migration protein RuvA [Clostridia bacterium]|nr:Holliday junction branch migration protein RuvA [Clostridia bacterium]
MFYYLRGRLAVLTNDTAVVDCGGVGYKLSVSASTASKCAPALGKDVTLFTHLSVREDAMDLFGFYSEEELRFFRFLTSVSGIGPKGAMAVLSTFSTDDLQNIIFSGDHKSLSRAPGIGAKTAQRIIMELKDKIGAGFTDDPPAFSGTAPGDPGVRAQVVDTLLLYGFDRQQIETALKAQDLRKPLPDLIADTLRFLGTR